MGIRDRTETRLLDAAEEMFFTRGVAATPVDVILDRAGISSATLYRGYPSKEALVAAALDRRHATWLAEWDAAVAASTTPVGALLAVFDALDGFRSRPEGARWCAFLGTAAEYADPPAELAEALARETTAYRERLTRFATDAGAADPAALAAQLLLVISGDLAMRLRTPDATTADARAIAEILVRAACRR